MSIQFVSCLNLYCIIFCYTLNYVSHSIQLSRLQPTYADLECWADWQDRSYQFKNKPEIETTAAHLLISS